MPGRRPTTQLGGNPLSYISRNYFDCVIALEMRNLLDRPCRRLYRKFGVLEVIASSLKYATSEVTDFFDLKDPHDHAAHATRRVQFE